MAPRFAGCTVRLFVLGRLEMHNDSGLVGGLGPEVGVVHLEARFEVERQPILILTVISLFVQPVQEIRQPTGVQYDQHQLEGKRQIKGY